MPTNTRRQAKTIGKQKIWPSVLCNLLLIFLICGAIGGGLVFYLSNMLQNRIASISNDMTNCATAVDASFYETLVRAERYAQVIQERCFDASPGIPVEDVLLGLQRLENDDDIGFIARDGTASSIANLVENAVEQPFYTETLAGEGGVYSLDGQDACIVYTAPVGTAGVLYLADSGGMNSGKTLAPFLQGVSTYLILNDENQVVTYISQKPGDFDYQTLLDSGDLFIHGAPVNIRPLMNTKYISPAIMLSENHGNMTPLEVFTTLKESYLSLSAWYENPLSVHGWRTVAYSVQSFDGFSLLELAFILLGAAIIILMLLVFSISSTVSRISHNRKLNRALLFDPVTGGNNFQHFKTAVEKVLKNRRYYGKVMAIVALDVDKFRVFSDVHGHEKGEYLLFRIFQYFTKRLQKGELICRYSVDQFSLLLILAPDEDPEARVTRLLQDIRKVWPEERVTCSAGIYMVQDRRMSVERMYSCAAVAKDAARQNGNGCIMCFTNAMRDKLLNEQQIETLMEKALKNREFVVYLQPKYSVREHRLSGAEALVRWIGPEMGFVSPGDFIPLFEKNGFIKKLDDYILTGVCCIQQQWLSQGKTLFPISVNISRANFADREIAKHICSIVDTYGIPHDMIELELTESAFFDDKEVLVGTVKQLRAYGFPVTMDDFGSGFSSLNSLKDLPLDVVKLDKEFFETTLDVDRGVTLIRDTIALAKNLHMEVVAEGIETGEQVAFLAETGCDLIQGYYFAKPLPIEEFEKLELYKA